MNYKIVRVYADRKEKVIRKDLTLNEAREWVSDPATENDSWIDHYERQQ